MASSERRSNHFDVFLSLRFCEAQQEAQTLYDALTALGYRVFIANMLAGDNLQRRIAQVLDTCSLVVVLATATYGRETTSFSTYHELNFVIEEKKNFFLIKMCDRWEYPEMRLSLGTHVAYERWMPGEEMPTRVLDGITQKLRMLASRTPTSAAMIMAPPQPASPSQRPDPMAPGTRAVVHGAQRQCGASTASGSAVSGTAAGDVDAGRSPLSDAPWDTDSQPAASPAQPRVRLQRAVAARFVPVLLREGSLFRKNSTMFLRRATKGERVQRQVDDYDGPDASPPLIATDDGMWVVCNVAAGEFYVIKGTEFDECYEAEGKAIDPAATAQRLSQSVAFMERLNIHGFKEYTSKRRVLAHKVTLHDMEFFTAGGRRDDCGSVQAQFVAPWGEAVTVHVGDYLVMSYPQTNDEVYRIERGVFAYTFSRVGAQGLDQARRQAPVWVVATGLFVIAAAATAWAVWRGRRRRLGGR